MVHCFQGTDFFLLCVIIAPLLTLGVGFLLGCLLSYVEGWMIQTGFWYIVGNVSGTPNPLVQNVPATKPGKYFDIYFSLFAVVFNAVIVGLSGMLAYTASIPGRFHIEKSSLRGIFMLVVGIPIMLFAFAAGFGGLMALGEGWSWWNGCLFVVSAVAGLGNPLTANNPASIHGKILSVVIGIAAQGFDGMVIGITASMPFVGKVVSWFQVCLGSVYEAANPDDDGMETNGIELGPMKQEVSGDDVEISAVKITMSSKPRLNGFYNPYIPDETQGPVLQNGRPLFQNFDHPDVWLRYCTNRKWMVSQTKDKNANNNLGFAHTIEADLEFPWLATGWKVFAPFDDGIKDWRRQFLQLVKQERMRQPVGSDDKADKGSSELTAGGDETTSTALATDPKPETNM